MEIGKCLKKGPHFFYVAPDIYTHSHTHNTYRARAKKERRALNNRLDDERCFFFFLVC